MPHDTQSGKWLLTANRAMKLKFRILMSVVASVVLALLFVTSFSAFYHSDSFDLSYPDPASLRGISPKRAIFEEIRRLSSTRKKQKRTEKKRKRAEEDGSNSNNGTDSDRAAEVVMAGHEYDRLIKDGDLLPKRSERPLVDVVPDYPRSESQLQARYVRECVRWRDVTEPDDTRENFADLEFDPLWEEMESPERVTLQEMHGIEMEQDPTTMEQFYLGVSNLDLYAENDNTVDLLLREMNINEIVHAVEKEGGTQLKLTVTYYDGSQAMLKPMRFDRDSETKPDHFYFVDFERHNSEIAAFHLDRILGFRRCPPVVGRVLNVTTEVYAVTEEEMLKTFFISPAQNICFHGHCSYYCDTSHAICGRPDTLEVSLAAFLPPDRLSGRKSWKNPWKRTYQGHSNPVLIYPKWKMFLVVVRECIQNFKREQVLYREADR